MLVLSRKTGERIVIGPDIEVTVLEVRGDRVRLGIQAPLEVSVHREEVFCRIQSEMRGILPFADQANADFALAHSVTENSR